jgi:Ser/Thr protein kinase RdoA (MazF antagonist)
MIPVYRSLLDPAGLVELVRRGYGLDVVGCTLVRSFVNDVYELATPAARYVLKVYRHGFWSVDEVAWEGELAAYLAGAGVPIARMVPRADGALAAGVAAPEGVRPYAVWRFVDGRKPRPEAGLYRDFGRLVARFHEAAAGFASMLPRRPFDLPRVLDEPLTALLPRLGERDRAMVAALAATARERITGYQGLDWGVCHGDVTLDNVHLTGTGLVLHDLDLAGERCRAADLYGVAATPHWDAFLAGYTAVRAFGERDRAALPWFRVVQELLNLHFHLVAKPALRGTESIGEGWADEILAGLRTAADTLS